MEDEVTLNETKASVKALITKFGETTTMHGMSRVVGSRNVGRKIVWLFLVFSSMSWAIFQLTVILREFYSYPITTKVSVEYQPRLAFPAVTICNLNRIRKSKADKIKAIIKSLQDLPPLARDTGLETNLRQYTMEELWMAVHQLDDMLIDCTFDMRKCTKEHFIPFYSPSSGGCYTFGDRTLNNFNFNTTKPGSKNGLILELDIGKSDYITLTESAGIKVIVHSESELFPDDEGMLVAPGYNTAIGVRKVENYLLPAPYGNCINADNSDIKLNFYYRFGYKYTGHTCKEACFQVKLYEQCGCTDMHSGLDKLIEITGIKPNNGSIPFCEEKHFLGCVYNLSLDFQEHRLGCMERCPPECDQVSYKTVISHAAWPVDSFMDNYIKYVNKTASEKNKTYTFIGDPREHIRKNFIKLEIFYESLNYEVFRAKPSYDWNKVISDIGGQLGLWLGFSLLTAVEVLELLLYLSHFLVKKSVKLFW